MGYWVDMANALPHDGLRRTSRASGGRLSKHLRQGAADRGLPRRALLPALRHDAVRPRARAGLRDHHGPVGLRALPADLGPARRRRRRCWSGPRRRGRWCPTPRSPSTPTSPTSSATNGDETLVVAEPLIEKALGEGWTVAASASPAATWSAGRTSGPFELVDLPGAEPGALRGARRLRHDRGRHRTGAPVPRVRRGRHGGLQGLRPAGRQPDHAGRALRGRRPRWSAGSSSRPPTRRWSTSSSARGLLFGELAYEHSYPHCWRCHTPLMYYALPAWYIRTTAIKDELLRENEQHQLVPRDDQERPLRRLAEQQHRLVAVAQPLLGHAAADLAQRRGPQQARVRRLAAPSCRSYAAAT